MEKQSSKYRWVVFASVLLAYLLIVSQRTAPGLISDQLMKEFHISAAVIGLLASIQFFAYAGLQIPIGILSDRFGPNIFLIAGTLINGLGTFIYSIAPNEFVLLFARLLVGMGDATIWINLVILLSQWFKANDFVGLIGVAGTAGSMGFFLATVPFSAWMAASGWRQPFFVIGMVIFLAGILLYYVLVKKPKQLFSGDGRSPTRISKEREKTWVILRRTFTSRQAWAAFLCHFGLVGTYVGFIGSWAVPYGMHVYGMTRSGASQLIMIGLFGAVIGAPLTSWIANRLETIKWPYVIAHLIVWLSWFAFLVFGGKPPFALLLIMYLLIGYGNGASSMTFAVVRKYFAIKEVGVVSGFANTGGFISAILLPAVFGKVLDLFHHSSSQVGYHFGFIIPVIFSFLGLVGGLLIKERQRETTPVNE
ncbi:MAG: MFS transporter [Tuberibacillus sp.]